MYVIVIDESKYNHDCIISKEDTGEIVRDLFSIENSRSVFNRLLEVLKTLDPTIKKIVFESARHYHDNFKIFLENEGLDFMELNALLVNKVKSSQTLSRVETYKTNTLLIANYLCKIEFKPYSKLVLI